MRGSPLLPDPGLRPQTRPRQQAVNGENRPIAEVRRATEPTSDATPQCHRMPAQSSRSSARRWRSSLIGSAQNLEGIRVQLSCVLRSLFGFRIHAKPSVRVREIDVDPWVVRIGLRGNQKLLQSLLVAA